MKTNTVNHTVYAYPLPKCITYRNQMKSANPDYLEQQTCGVPYCKSLDTASDACWLVNKKTCEDPWRARNGLSVETLKKRIRYYRPHGAQRQRLAKAVEF